MHVFVTCRTQAKGQPVVEQIIEETGNPAVECLAMELGDFDSVRSCAEGFLARDLPLHLLVNNAGLGVQRGHTPSGFELAFGVNHLGPFLFTTLLLDRILRSAPARIVTVASVGHHSAKGIDFDAVCRMTASFYGSNEYYVSKLGNVLFSAELGRRLEGTGVTTYSLHPGVVATNVWRRFPWPLDAIAKAFMMSVEDGAKTTLYCATSPEVAKQNGLYYDSCALKEPSDLAKDQALARKLWDKSEQWVGYRHSFE
jgi:NAD(P)-dependent dehydrogenase (short-subunit alcohol dehydrogenase family)